MFKKLRNGTVNENETAIFEYWQKNKVFEKSIEEKDENKNFVFYDGPIYANAKPGIHHVFAKEIKDSFCRYKTMQGYRVLRKIGLDTHGLPIEVNVEKKLGFKNKTDIEKFGLENFNNECKKATDTNIDDVVRLTNMMGQFIDTDNPYVTCTNDYIETEWWIVNELNKKGLIYHGNKVLPYCPRCGTELASHEVSQGYKDVSVNSCYVPFKVKGKDEYLLAWTTTAWTLLANLALCANPKMDYVKVKSRGYTFILGKTLVDKVLGDDYEVLEEFKGTKLKGLEYEQLMPFLKVEGKAFQVLNDEYVTDADGTGIVHMAPAFGEDDNKVCKANDIAFYNPVDKNGCYTLGPWEGRLVTDPELEIDIIKWLKANDKLFKKEKIVHNYPHCWRCKQPLIFYSKSAWYVNNTSKKKEIIEANNKINWYPDYVGKKRFNNWLENMIDWGISRNRYWGCPIPIWECSCGHFESVGSIKELKEKAIEEVPDNLELHRPYVDNYHIKCPDCGKEMSRVSDVLDVWFDSGSMPYAQYHYPFENKELFENQFPADFIAEGVDQTRGWFYVLLVLSTLISGKSSYKNVLVNDLMLDATGKKMSKSLGNTVEPFDTITKYGADAVRFYLVYVSPVWTPLKFNEEGLKEVYSKYLSTLKNTYSFFEMYANADNIDPREYNIPVEKRELIDRWLLSKLNKLVDKVTKAYEKYDLNEVTRLIIPFLNDDLSNWYIRSTRRRFWDSELTESKKAVYLTTYEVLETLVKLTAPITPFITDEIYQNLTGETSIHLAEFPKANKKLIDEKVEKQMDLIRDICSLGRFAREEASIKVRQPINEIILDKKNEKTIGNLVDVIKEELNVKNVTYKSDMTKYFNYNVKPNFKEVGKVLGPRVKEFGEVLTNFGYKEIEKINKGGYVISLGGDDYTITPEMVIESISSKEGFASSSDGNISVVLDTNLTEDLILEGLAREFVRNVQNLRKEKDFVITDHINVYYHGDKEIEDMFKKYKEYIMGEVLGEKLIKKEDISNEFELNGVKCLIDVERV